MISCYGTEIGTRSFDWATVYRTHEQTNEVTHDKDNDAFGLVWRFSYGHPMLDYSGDDTDTSTYMARFPEQHFTIVCLSNMPLGDAEGKADAVLDLLHNWRKL